MQSGIGRSVHSLTGRRVLAEITQSTSLLITSAKLSLKKISNPITWQWGHTYSTIKNVGSRKKPEFSMRQINTKSRERPALMGSSCDFKFYLGPIPLPSPFPLASSTVALIYFCTQRQKKYCSRSHRGGGNGVLQHRRAIFPPN